MDTYDLAKLDDVDLIEHVTMRDAYIAAGRPRICPRCGGRSQGLYLPMCPDPGWAHEETCQGYHYADRVCPPCAAEMGVSEHRVGAA